jgi:hypothetical protein
MMGHPIFSFKMFGDIDYSANSRFQTLRLGLKAKLARLEDGVLKEPLGYR